MKYYFILILLFFENMLCLGFEYWEYWSRCNEYQEKYLNEISLCGNNNTCVNNINNKSFELSFGLNTYKEYLDKCNYVQKIKDCSSVYVICTEAKQPSQKGDPYCGIDECKKGIEKQDSTYMTYRCKEYYGRYNFDNQIDEC